MRTIALILAFVVRILNSRRIHGLRRKAPHDIIAKLELGISDERVLAMLLLSFYPMVIPRSGYPHRYRSLGSVLQTGAPTQAASLKIQQIWAMSDIHTDVIENYRFITKMDPYVHRNDALIVAGDISDDIDVVRKTLRRLRAVFARVFFVVGNHELWVRRRQPDMNSFQKLLLLEELCKEEGVDTQPQRLETDAKGGVWIVPLLSWHCQSFDCEPDIDSRWEGIITADRLCSDYRLCRWPAFLNHSNDSVAAWLDTRNDKCIEGCDIEQQETLQRLFQGGRDSDEVVVSFSHFLPRIELMPEKRFLRRPSLTKFVGSPFLGQRLKQLKPDVHIFGHTHFGWDQRLDSIRYISSPMGTPRERLQRLSTVATGSFPMAALREDRKAEPLLIWNATHGLSQSYEAAWSGFYDAYEREPEQVTALPDYVARKYSWNESKHGPQPVFHWPREKKAPWSFSPNWTRGQGRRRETAV